MVTLKKVWECVAAFFSGRTMSTIEIGYIRVSRKCNGKYRVSVLLDEYNVSLVIEDDLPTQYEARRVANRIPWYWPKTKLDSSSL